MTSLDALKKLQKFLKENVSQKIKLQCDNQKIIEYVNPYVELGFLPHKNFLPVDFQSPFMLVSMDSSEDDTDTSIARFRIVCNTYGGGFYKDKNGLLTTIPDCRGYIDLLNLMEITRQELLKTQVIENCLVIQDNIQYGIYDSEIVYPYWYGYIMFSAYIPATPYLNEGVDF